jgi:hypothetical protein
MCTERFPLCGYRWALLSSSPSPCVPNASRSAATGGLFPSPLLRPAIPFPACPIRLCLYQCTFPPRKMSTCVLVCLSVPRSSCRVRFHRDGRHEASSSVIPRYCDWQILRSEAQSSGGVVTVYGTGQFHVGCDLQYKGTLHAKLHDHWRKSLRSHGNSSVRLPLQPDSACGPYRCY